MALFTYPTKQINPRLAKPRVDDTALLATKRYIQLALSGLKLGLYSKAREGIAI